MSDSEFVNDSDQDVSESHSKLIEAIAELDKRQRIKKPERSEPTSEVSEFHLPKSATTARDAVYVRDLAKSLGRKGHHIEITKKLQSVQRSTKVLPKPLEKPAADRIKRIVGFENVKKDVQKWNAIITRNRVAEKLHFPLNQSSMKVEPSNAFLKRFRIQSDLEKELAKLEPVKNDVEEKDDEFALTLEEIIEKRKEAARFRAQQSYKEAKASRLRKIKSKKFHRVQRKEKTKQQLKEFEELQKTDPQAALEKLELLDKARAQERMSLRHKNTGQWARNKQIKAKYDKETRQVLAQQLSISRELTQKVQKNEDSEDDDTENDPSMLICTNNKENPWLNDTKTESEIDNFISSYRKYWDNQKKTEQKQNEKATDENSQDKSNIVIKNEKVVRIKKFLPNGLPRMANPVTKVVTEYKEDVNKNKENNNSVPQKNQFKTEKTRKDTYKLINKTKIISEKNILQQLNHAAQKKQETFPNNVVSNPVLEGIPENSNIKMVNLNRNDLVCDTVGTSRWNVQTIEDNNKHETRNKLNKLSTENISEMFNTVEEKIQSKVESKLQNAKRKYNNETKATKRKVKKQDDKSQDVYDGLEIKNKKQKPIIDEPMLENTTQEHLQKEKDTLNLKNLIQNTNSITNKSKNNAIEIDPNKYINVKPKRLNTHMPDIVTGGDDALDDSDDEKRRYDIISEAFADDDVIEEFKKEKEAEVIKSQPGDIDLSLPGWGSWGGKNIKMSNSKKKRFILRFPKDAPRRDDNKGDVIILEDNDAKVRQHQVNELPHPFTSVKDFEASMRAPIGRNFVPENAHKRLTEPAIKTRIGTIIEPMDEDILINTKKMKKRLPVGRQNKNNNSKHKSNKTVRRFDKKTEKS